MCMYVFSPLETNGYENWSDRRKQILKKKKPDDI